MKTQAFGRYLLDEQLGRGGMATVFRARDPEFDRDVAIKVLPEDLLHDPEFRSRFQREARTVARLEHPAIVPVYDIGEEQGQPYLVMRYMPGGTLAQKLAEGPLPLAGCVAVIRRISSALDEAHRRGMVHRDVKPGNILFDSHGEAYLSDFGIVKWSQAATTLTGAGMVGTPAYMSPEQSEGRPDVGPPADIYALGVVLFQMLTGRLPFQADTPVGLALKHMREPIPQLSKVDPTVPAGLQVVIERAMAKRPEDRYARAADLAQALETNASPTRQAAPDPNVTVVETGRAEQRGPTRPQPELQTLRASRRRSVLVPLIVAGAVLGAGAVAIALVQRGRGTGLSASETASAAVEASLASVPPTSRVLPTSTPLVTASATEPPAGIEPGDVNRIVQLWSAQVASSKADFDTAWSPAGDVIAVSAPAQAGVALWDAILGAPRSVLKDPMGIYDVGALTWSPDSERVAALVDPDSARGTPYSLDVWGVADGEVLLRVPRLPFCHPKWSPDGRFISCGPAMIEVQTGDRLWTGAGEVWQSAFSPDGALVALGATSGTITVYDVATGLTWLTLPGHKISVSSLSWSSEDTLASGSRDGEILGWPGLSASGGSAPPPAKAETGGALDLAWAPGALQLLSGNLDHAARLWDQGLQLIGEFEHPGVVLAVTWSPDGLRFATGADDGVLRVWGVPSP